MGSTEFKYVRGAESDSVTLLDQVISAIRDKRRILYISVVAIALLAGAYYHLQPDRFTARAKVMPVANQAKGMAGSIIGSLIQSSALSGMISSQIGSEGVVYSELIRSRSVLDGVLNHSYNDVLGGRSGTLPELWEIGDREIARLKLSDAMIVSNNGKTGMLSIGVTTVCPELSSQIANATVRELDLYKQTVDREMAAEVSRYFEGKLAEQQKLVSEAEKAQLEFRNSNRNFAFGDDPLMQLEQDRLERDVSFQRQVLLSVMQFKAQSDMEREKEIPRLSVIEWAIPPVFKSGPRRLTSIAMTILMGILFVVGLISLHVAVRWYFPSTTQSELTESVNSVRGDVRQFYSLLQTRMQGHSADRD